MNEAKRFERGEVSIEALTNFVNEGVALALSEIERRFEDPEDRDMRDRLLFHGTQHTQGVMRRTIKILAAIQKTDKELVSDKDIQLGRLAAVFHDTVQSYKVETSGEGDTLKMSRKRNVGTNEEASAAEALSFMRSINTREGKKVFLDEDLEVVRTAIKVTVPSFDSVAGTVVQDGLEDSSPVVARALALADLGVAGMEGGETFLREGFRLILEENIDLAEIPSLETISPVRKENLRQRIVSRIQSEVAFVTGRKALFEKEIRAFPEVVARELRDNLFTKFDASIAAAKDMAERAATASFEELIAVIMGS